MLSTVATGPRNLVEPLNSVLPAWDVAMGTLSAVGMLAAERRRRLTGEGTLVRLREAFDGTGVSWGPYQTFQQLVTDDAWYSEANPMFATIEHPGVAHYLAAASPLDFDAAVPARRAPASGEHTEEVLRGMLGLTQSEVGRLHDRGFVRCSARASSRGVGVGS